MFHEDGMQLRFEVQQERGDTILHVMPKRGQFSGFSRSERSGSGRSSKDPSPRNPTEPSKGASEKGASASSTEAYVVRPIPKKAPLPPPPSFSPKETPGATPREAHGPLKALKAPKLEVKAEQSEEPDFEDEPSPPDPPPGEHWEEYEDAGTPWFYYFGPKGHWCCQGPGKPVLPYDTTQ